MPDEINFEDWNSNRKLVLSELQRMSAKLDGLAGAIGGDITTMKVAIATNRVRTTLIAAGISAVASGIIALLVTILAAKLK